MKLASLVGPERVIVPLEATTLPLATNMLIQRLIATGAVREPEKLWSRVAEVRGEDLVALGDRAFLLHYRTDAVDDLAVAIGVAPVPVERDIGEGEAQRARLLLLIIAPPRMAGRYLQVLGALGRALRSPAAVQEIVETQAPDALAALAIWSDQELPDELLVRDLMTEHPRTVAPDELLRDAARMLARANVHALPVVDANGVLLGLLSQRELLRILLAGPLVGPSGVRPPQPDAHRAVRDVMTRQVLCIAPEQSVAEAATLLANKDLDGVPVVREGRLVGYLSRGDIIRKLIGS